MHLLDFLRFGIVSSLLTRVYAAPSRTMSGDSLEHFLMPRDPTVEYIIAPKKAEGMVKGVKRLIGPIETEPPVEKLTLLFNKYRATTRQVKTVLDSSIDDHKRVKYWIAIFSAAGLREVEKTIENDPEMKALQPNFITVEKLVLDSDITPDHIEGVGSATNSRREDTAMLKQQWHDPEARLTNASANGTIPRFDLQERDRPLELPLSDGLDLWDLIAISTPPGNAEKDVKSYNVDAEQGQGVKVFFFENGVDKVPSAWDDKKDKWYWLFEDQEKQGLPQKAYGSGHGTGMFAKAVGKDGVARKASGILVAWNNQEFSSGICLQAMSRMTELMQTDEHKGHRAVLAWPHSWTFTPAARAQASFTALLELLEDEVNTLNELGVPMIISAGNDGQISQAVRSDTWPAILMHTHPEIIDIGASQKDGKLYGHSRQSKSGLYAPGKDITTKLGFTPVTRSGSSLSAAIAAAQLAVWAASKPDPFRTSGYNGKSALKLYHREAYKRHGGPIPIIYSGVHKSDLLIQ